MKDSLTNSLALAIVFAMLATVVWAADYTERYQYHEDETPPVVVLPYGIAPIAPVAPIAPIYGAPRCHTERTTEHDDILNTNNYTEREECDE